MLNVCKTVCDALNINILAEEIYQRKTIESSPISTIRFLFQGNFTQFLVDAARPKSKSHVADPPRKISEPFIIQKDLNLGPLFDFQLTNLHYVYICIKVDHRNQNYYSTYMLSRLCSLSGALPFSNIMRE